MAYDLSVTFTISGRHYDRVGLIYGAGRGLAQSSRIHAPGSGYSIELAAVIEMLKDVDNGHFSAEELHSIFHRFIEQRESKSQCCTDCDDAFDSHVAALKSFEQETEMRDQIETDREHADYLLTATSIHAADCRSAKIQAPTHPGTLHEFVHVFGYGSHGVPENGSYDLMSEPELIAWFLKHNTERRRCRRICKLCKHRMPAPLKSPEITPACWDWVPPVIKFDQPSSIATAMQHLEDWQAGRCAICILPSTLVVDHDRTTGLVRGLLCNSCNPREGKSLDAVFKNYRQKHPATILDLEVSYFAWKDHKLRTSKKAMPRGISALLPPTTRRRPPGDPTTDRNLGDPTNAQHSTNLMETETE